MKASVTLLNISVGFSVRVFPIIFNSAVLDGWLVLFSLSKAFVLYT